MPAVQRSLEGDVFAWFQVVRIRLLAVIIGPLRVRLCRKHKLADTFPLLVSVVQVELPASWVFPKNGVFADQNRARVRPAIHHQHGEQLPATAVCAMLLERGFTHGVVVRLLSKLEFPYRSRLQKFVGKQSDLADLDNKLDNKLNSSPYVVENKWRE